MSHRADDFNRNWSGKSRSPKSFARVLSVFVLTAVLAGCTATIDQRGFVPEHSEVERVKVGLQGREEVRDILGSPSSVSVFNDERWYYISKKTSTYAFLSPKVLDQRVVVVEFDDGGMVREVRHYTLEDGQVVDPVTRKTPAPGRELTFIEQLIGNFGRFNERRDR